MVLKKVHDGESMFNLEKVGHLFIQILLLFTIFWLSIKPKPLIYQAQITSGNIFINSELTCLPEKLCYVWVSTRDVVLRKFNLPSNRRHRYGLNLQINRRISHASILLLLAGDIATNPGPLTQRNNSNVDSLNVLYLNARSLKAFVTFDSDPSCKVCKISLLQELVLGGAYDVICICETWLNDTIMSSELLPDYNIFRRDRIGKVGGGVLVAVKENLQATKRPDLESEGMELVVLELTKANNKAVILYTFYRPPGSSPESLSLLNNSMQNTPESSCIVLVGDFNFPTISWSNDQTTPVNFGESEEENLLCDLVGDNFLQQFVKGPTHSAGNKLDLVLCNCAETIADVSTITPAECNFPTDHHIIEFRIQMKFRRAKSVRRRVYDYKQANFTELRNSLLHVPFDMTLTNNIDDCWIQWKDLFLAVVNNHVPVKTINDTNSPPWIDGEVRHLIRKKYAALKKYRLDKTPERKLKLRSSCQSIKYAIKCKHREYLAKIEASFKDNPKMFWSYHKAILHHRSTLNPVISYRGEKAKTPAKKAELFNSFFCSVFRPVKQNNNPDNPAFPLRTDTQLSEITLCVDEVAASLSNLDPTKASGPDGIPCRLLKECSEQIAPSLCALFNHSLHSGCIPSEWKSADVTPIHKKDKKEPADNYRPISLLPIVSKVLESCVYKRLHDHVRHLISLEQHGFLSGRSCVTQLLPTLHSIGQLLDKNVQTDVLYLDFAKAFDSVDHGILLEKLKSYGVTGELHGWFTDYLRGRTQRVIVEGAASKWSTITSGVPQGSILGPILFVLFINDIPDVIQNDTSTALYADDVKLYKGIRSFVDSVQLQEALSNANFWSQESNISFNSSKCKILTVSRKKSPMLFDYHLGSADLLRVNKEIDLGVKMTSNLSWDSHIHMVTAKANKLLGLLRRTCPLLKDCAARRTLYLSLVKSQLCYATEVWSPSLSTHKAKPERIQRRATRWILQCKIGGMPYKERLLALDLLPLSYDREIKDLTFLYKTLYGLTDLDVSNFVSFVSHSRTRLCNNPNLMLKVPSCKTKTFQSSYFNRIVPLWNSICKTAPPSSFCSLSTLKRFLSKTYKLELISTFDIHMPCTWSLVRDCPCHRVSVL